MLVESSSVRVRDIIRQAQRSGATSSVVPTMGALHFGHVSLMEIARQQTDFVVATIFVNPMQFGPNEDFDRYPRTLDDDLRKCDAAGVDLVFTPETSELFSADAECDVRVKELTQMLEGARRPGHFDGVTTIVAKLFNVTTPDKAYFGQKDFQQQLVIKRMVRDLNWGIEIVTCPIIREKDGLAMSSRNRYLSVEERKRALCLSQALTAAEQMAVNSVSPEKVAEQLVQNLESVDGIELDYAVVVDSETLQPVSNDADQAVAVLAARVGRTRLIDNSILSFR